MSENKNGKIGRHAAAQDKREILPETDEHATTTDDRENAPRSRTNEPQTVKQKRSKAGVGLICAALLLVLAIGGAGGYLVARHSNQSETRTDTVSGREIRVVTEAPTARADENLSDADREALSALAGEDGAVETDMSFLVGEDDLTNEAQETQAGDDVVVAEYDGGTVLSSEAAEAYSAQMAGLIFNGYDEEEVGGNVLTSVIESLVSDRILEAHAREMGLYELTDEDEAAIEEEADQSYQAQLDYYKQQLDTSDMTDEEANGAAKAYLQEYEGVTPTSVKNEIETQWWKRKIYDAITQDVTVDDTQVREAYDTLLREQQESFTDYPEDYESTQMNGETIVYNLPGYRAVRLLLIGFDDQETASEVQELKEQLSSDETNGSAQTRLDELYASAEEQAREALTQLQNGADFEEMIDHYGADEGMKDETLRHTGYYVAEDSPLWTSELITAAMALEKAGDISDLVRLDGGVGILQYVGDVPQGVVAYDSVKDTLAQQTLESAKQSAYDAQLTAWIEAADVKYYPERMQ